jgi:hypothetical protein
MGRESVTATKEQIEQSVSGFMMQAHAHGLDIENNDLQRFIRHVANVEAQDKATILHLYSNFHPK